MTIVIAGLGSALPPGSLTQADAASAANRLLPFADQAIAQRQLQVLNALYRRSGVQTRHSVLLQAGEGDAVERQTFYEEAVDGDDRGPTTAARMRRYEVEAPALAERACRQALQAAAVAAESITDLVTVSCSGFNSPGFDLALYPRLGLQPETSRTHIGFMGCHAALNGLRVARAIVAANPAARVLLCAVELCTLHHQYTADPQQIVANSLFADGAAAAVVCSRGINGHAIDNAGNLPATSPRAAERTWRLIESKSLLVPESSEAMSWRIGNHGFCMTLSTQVPEIIKSSLRTWLMAWLAEHDLTLGAIENWAVHPGGPRILGATATAIGLSTDAFMVSAGVLSDCGNMSSPTILFILERLLAVRTAGPCVALAFGPGLVVEAVLLA